ncbi:arylsulfotransferase family protein [Streptomyces sp. NPDC008150]|uniref:arylsulfotransferase family protein n=1 Tax=Streptomyces sp. NPDC008150 TaxID=3364816 RepID=UPI0036E49205
MRATLTRLYRSVAVVMGVSAVAGALTAVSPAAAAETVPGLAPLTVSTDRAGSGDGEIFVAPASGVSDYSSGAEILSSDGRKVLWSHTAAPGTSDADFRRQTYRGRPVLTFWEGKGLGGLATGTDYIYDTEGHEVAEVRAGNGYSADGHEFQLTSRGTALIVSYAKKTADLTALGGSDHQQVIDGIVQEVDVRTGKVLFEWDAAQHVPYSQSEQPLPASADTPWDWFHVNAVKQDGNGALLVDARNTWTTYQIDRRSGDIRWQLGGKKSSFKLKAANGLTLNDADRIFAWQHDPEPLGNGLYTIFDNESAGVANTGQDATAELSYSRTVTVRVDTRAKTATLVRALDQPSAGLASSQGNAQTLANGNQVVGWGSLGAVSEFGPSGRLLFNASFPAGVVSYRAYRFDWKH